MISSNPNTSVSSITTNLSLSFFCSCVKGRLVSFVVVQVQQHQTTTNLWNSTKMRCFHTTVNTLCGSMCAPKIKTSPGSLTAVCSWITKFSTNPQIGEKSHASQANAKQTGRRAPLFVQPFGSSHKFEVGKTLKVIFNLV